MKEILWTDRRGYRHRSLIRDDDDESDAPLGLRRDPPNIEDLDWEGVKKDLHNKLVDQGLCSWRDVQQRGGLRGAIVSALKRRLVALYREVE